MLKTSSKESLFRIASNNIYFGGASAMVLAKRIKDPEAMEIVSSVYSVSGIQENPYTQKECEWCGSLFVPADSPYDCAHYAFCSESCAESFMT